MLLRWLHVVAGIVWVGTSFYFVALDNHLRAPERRIDFDEGVRGESWEIHGGGFYRVQKFRLAPERLPQPLHWFKWEAYTTWLSGFGLMVVLYYVNADIYLVDPEVADLPEAAAIALSVGLLAAAWGVYDGLCRLLESRPALLATVLAATIAAAAYGAGNLFSGRAAFLQVGAMLGTIMAANVLFVIIPAHWELVRAKEAGREPSPEPARRGKERSVHNNYLTLPVVFAMISNHFPAAHGRDHAWLILVALMAIGAWVRHFFNLRHAGRTEWAIPVTAVVGLVLLAVAIRPDDEPVRAAAGAQPVSFETVRGIVAARCLSCHARDPSNSSFSAPPAGLVLETPEQIRASAEAIERQAVDSRAMPLGNVTQMTERERKLLGAWIDAGAKTE